MGATRPPEGFDPKLASLIAFNVRRATRRYPTAMPDADDLQQDLSMQLVVAMKAYDPSKSKPQTFADRVIARRVIDLIKTAKAKKRACRREESLDVEAHVVLKGPKTQARLDTAMDVQEAVSRLTPELREIAILLTKHSEVEVVRLAGLSRERVRGMTRRIGRHFQAVGLGPNQSSKK